MEKNNNAYALDHARGGYHGIFVMAWQEKDKKTIKDIQIQIAGEETQLFINERDIKEMLKAGGHIIGAQMSSLNLSAIEKQ